MARTKLIYILLFIAITLFIYMIPFIIKFFCLILSYILKEPLNTIYIIVLYFVLINLNCKKLWQKLKDLA